VIRTVAAAIHTAPKVGNLKRLQAVTQSDAFMHLSVRQIDGGFRLPPLSTLGNLQRPKSHARVKARARREWPGRHQHLRGGSCPSRTKTCRRIFPAKEVKAEVIRRVELIDQLSTIIRDLRRSEAGQRSPHRLPELKGMGDR